MNGRVYDPLTAMFFSPDPFIQAPGNWLNYNRYGYCMNNPTRYTDPTGYQMAQQNTAWFAQGDWGFMQGNSGSEFIPFRAGGGGGSSGFTSWDQVEEAANDLFNSSYGGITFGPGQTHYFNSDKETYFFGSMYLQNFGVNNDATGVESNNNSYALFVMRFVSLSKNKKHSKKLKTNRQLEAFVNDNFEDRLPNNDLTWMFWNNEWGETVPLDRSNKTSPLTVYIPAEFGYDLDLLYLCIDHELVHVNDWSSGRIERSLSMYNSDYALSITEYRAYSRSIWTSNTQFNGRYDFSSSYNNAVNGLPRGYKLVKFTYN